MFVLASEQSLTVKHCTDNKNQIWENKTYILTALEDQVNHIHNTCMKLIIIIIFFWFCF